MAGPERSCLLCRSTKEMEGNRYRRRRREELRRRRLRRARRKRLAVCVAGVAVIAALVAAGTGIWRGQQKEKQREEQRKAQQAEKDRQEKKVKSVVAAGYEAFLGEGVQETAAMQESGAEGSAFAQWVAEAYPEEMASGLPEAVADGDFTSEEAYQILGATMHVLSDKYQGLLADEDTAEANGIFVKGERSAPETRAGSEGSGKDTVTVTVAGDLCLEEDGFVIDKYDEVDDLEACISPEILELTGSADIFYLNHEYTVSDRGEALAGKLYTFRAKPERMALLEEMGTDLVSLANNHIYDYGEEGMLDTLDYLDKAGIPYVGGGRNIKEAGRPVYFIINGMKIGFVAASNAELTLYTSAAGEDTPGILEAYDTSLYDQVIAEASKECDYLIAYIHWGPEDVNQYAAYQTAQGKEFLDAGADIVVGGHPHVLQGMEYMDGKPVIYSMGDFWFNGETKYTGLLNLEISVDGLEQMSFTPCLQTGFTTQYIEDAGKQREMFDFLEGLSPNVQIDDKGMITEKQE